MWMWWSWHSQKSDECRIISRTTQHVRGSTSPAPVLVEDGPVCVCSMRWEAVVWQVCATCVFMLVWTVVCCRQSTCCGVHAHSLPYSTLLTVSLCDTWHGKHSDVGDSGWGHLKGWRWGSHNTSCSSRIGEGVCVTECPPIKTWEGVVLKEYTLCSCFVSLV